MRRLCVVCEIDISARHGNTKTCSTTCLREHRAKYMRLYGAANQEELTKYYKRYAARKRLVKELARTCCVCGASIAWAASKRNTCSVECKRKRRRVSMLAWRARVGKERIKEINARYIERNSEKIRARRRARELTEDYRRTRAERRRDPSVRAQERAYNRKRAIAASAALAALREMELV